VDSDSGRAPRHRDAYEQLGVSITQAFVRLRAHAYACNRQLADLARDIVPAGCSGAPARTSPGGSDVRISPPSTRALTAHPTAVAAFC